MEEIKEEQLLEPQQIYPNLRKAVESNANEYFDNLIKKANTDVQKNNQLCDNFYAKQNEIKEAEKQTGSIKGLKIFLIVLLILCYVVGFLVFCLSFGNPINASALICGILLIVLGIVLTVLVATKVKNVQKARENRLKKLKEEAEAIRQSILPTIASLNNLMDWGMPQEVIRKSAPLIQLDSNLDVKKYDYMVEKYGLIHDLDHHESVFMLQSGSINGNPFFLERNFVQTDGYKTYVGTKTISWTTTSVDSKGNTQYHHHTQTLTATVTKPCPYYDFVTYLVYCNDAAPNLTFSRVPTVPKDADDKDLKKILKDSDKKMTKLAEQATMDDNPNTNFTKMNNTEFESLFHAWDRSNEVEFRLLFTPLAQKNMVQLLKNKEPYGDDFSFQKIHRINFIESAHDQSLDFEGDPRGFQGFDTRLMKEHFVQYTLNFFQSIFYDLAPLLSIPLYQQTKPVEYIYKDVYSSNVSYYEQEVIANAFDQNCFKPDGAITPSILKTHFDGKENSQDDVTVQAYAFRGIKHVDYVPVTGGDGYIHDVAVPWVEYIPIEKTSHIKVSNCDMSLPQYRDKYGNQNFTTVFRNRIQAILDR